MFVLVKYFRPPLKSMHFGFLHRMCQFGAMNEPVAGDFRTGDFRTRRDQDSGDFRTEERSGQGEIRTRRHQDEERSGLGEIRTGQYQDKETLGQFSGQVYFEK